MMTFKVGDKVQWTHRGGSGRTISLERREGEITAVKGDVVTIKRGKRTYDLHVSTVRTLEQKSEVTDFIEAVFGDDSALTTKDGE